MNDRRFCTLVLILAVAALAAAQDAAPPDTTASSRLSVSLWPPEFTTLGMVWTPQGRFNDRIGLGLGAETLIAYRKRGVGEVPPSTLKLFVMGTTRNQWRVNVANDIHWQGGRNHARVRIDHDNLARRFFGLGPASVGTDPESYQPQSTLVYGEATLGVTEHLAVGPRVELHHQAIHNVRDGHDQPGDTVRGTPAGLVSGAGLVFGLDTRDCRLRTCRGVHLQGMAMAFLDGVGDHRFQVLNLDLRGYLPLAREQVLAVQIFYYGVSDNPPFWRLASLGGRAHSRAYSRDRWLDEHLGAFQVEWRWRVRGRFGVTPFAGAALVNHRLSEVHWSHLKPSLGLGLRLYPRGDGPPVPVRLDLAVGHRHLRAVLAVGEAF